jgi:hypothetical protein
MPKFTVKVTELGDARRDAPLASDNCDNPNCVSGAVASDNSDGGSSGPTLRSESDGALKNPAARDKGELSPLSE